MFGIEYCINRMETWILRKEDKKILEVFETVYRGE